MDPLSEILSLMRIRKAGFTRLSALAPWGLKSDGSPAIQFVLVVEGSGVLTTRSGSLPVPLSSGDVFILLGNEPYQLFDHESSVVTPCVDVEALRVGSRIEFGGGGDATTFISGFFEIDRSDVKPLLNVLPASLHLKKQESRTLAFQSVLELLACETENPHLGTEAAIGRLFELLFIHSVRAFATECSIPNKGWLAAMSDKNLALAIEAIHADPQKPWTVDLLAKVARMSRSAFAAKFKDKTDQTPLGYLTGWRIYKATRLLERNSIRIADVARTVGYASEAAFTKAFKKVVGLKPSEFRKASLLQVRTADAQPQNDRSAA
ncbi:AraC family transcriptional regulator [Rhizobium sp. Root1220]|uniref:AraC family transcriptional regulator n=1 Tax=Rhizobium sp. Root1220 TaxID=1736432 RepID=UPI0006FAD997|nr:AraC family transcriptional regulator [Rhizobium sp. Root1220]KQV78126.1 AraC family transcriptional regulator [Rhizobium sp. Root1220]